MLTDKELKKEFKKKCEKEPDKYYPVKTLSFLGFMRQKCSCGTYFWTKNTEQNVCGDPKCSGGFRFVGNSPAKNKLDYVETWEKFSEVFKKLGYSPVKRYPVVSRWNPTTDFTLASIAAFQPYVVTGEIQPPANPLVIPQFCLRFGDIDNVGITGAHYTGFVMLGQHAFVQPSEYDINLYLQHIHEWLHRGIGVPDEEITFHEDAWAGGGNFGPSMEFYSRGLELGNQVYMQYEQTPSGMKELKIKVLDMGAGQERVPWFTQGKSTSYETTFPTVIEKMFKKTGVRSDPLLMQKFLPYASYLNVDEVDDIDKAWMQVASHVKMDANELRKTIEPLASVYSIAEHTRALVVAITDGALPSNVGGMYNLRIILRRALSFIKKYGWDVDLEEVCEWHVEYLKKMYPELKEHKENVKQILRVEKEKYKHTMQKTENVVKNVLQKEIGDKQFVDLYDSYGISPDLVKEEALKMGKKIKVPDNFYALLAERHEQKETAQETATYKKRIEIDEELTETKALYFDNYKTTEFTGKIIFIKDKFVVLDKTAFYPTSGGQMHDVGMLNGKRVVDVFKQDNLIVHELENVSGLNVGQDIVGKIDNERRIQLAQHHTSTHIVNAAAAKVLGHHINQASAKKDVDKAHIDITHYELISDLDLKKIEEEANKIVKKGIKTNLSFVSRADAEKKYGIHIYQGGAVPGKYLRIVDIPGIDVEACGGTHLNNTSEAERIRILKCSKIKDGVVRIFFTAGKAAQKIDEEEAKLLGEITKALGCSPEEAVGRAKELFEMWKKARKGETGVQQSQNDSWHHSKPKASHGLRFAVAGDVKEVKATNAELIKQVCLALNSQPEHVVKTIERFKKEIEM